MDLASVLPLAFVMIAGPQIISAFFFATSDDWKRESAAYVLGASLSITAMATVGYLLASRLGNGDGGGDDGISWGIVALLVFAMVHVYRGRGESEPPKWMGKLQTATPKLAFTLGFLLLGFFPSDIVTSLTVGAHLGAPRRPLVEHPPLRRSHPAACWRRRRWACSSSVSGRRRCCPRSATG